MTIARWATWPSGLHPQPRDLWIASRWLRQMLSHSFPSVGTHSGRPWPALGVVLLLLIEASWGSSQLLMLPLRPQHRRPRRSSWRLSVRAPPYLYPVSTRMFSERTDLIGITLKKFGLGLPLVPNRATEAKARKIAEEAGVASRRCHRRSETPIPKPSPSSLTLCTQKELTSDSNWKRRQEKARKNEK